MYLFTIIKSVSLEIVFQFQLPRAARRTLTEILGKKIQLQQPPKAATTTVATTTTRARSVVICDWLQSLPHWKAALEGSWNAVAINWANYLTYY